MVTAVEPGGVIVVRFAGDGAERKLMADYAPLKHKTGSPPTGTLAPLMPATVIDGKAVAAAVRERVRGEVEELAGRARAAARAGHRAGRR